MYLWHSPRRRLLHWGGTLHFSRQAFKPLQQLEKHFELVTQQKKKQQNTKSVKSNYSSISSFPSNNSCFKPSSLCVACRACKFASLPQTKTLSLPCLLLSLPPSLSHCLSISVTPRQPGHSHMCPGHDSLRNIYNFKAWRAFYFVFPFANI